MPFFFSLNHSAHKPTVSIRCFQWTSAKLRVPAHWNSPDSQGSDKGECVTNIRLLTHLWHSPTWVNCPCISADGARRHNGPSGQNSSFESRKQRLSASLGWTGVVLRTFTLRKAKVGGCHCANKAPPGPIFSPGSSTDCLFLYNRQELCVNNWNWKDSAAFNRPGIPNCCASSRLPHNYAQIIFKQ